MPNYFDLFEHGAGTMAFIVPVPKEFGYTDLYSCVKGIRLYRNMLVPMVF
jgi:hypothetical protein